MESQPCSSKRPHTLDPVAVVKRHKCPHKCQVNFALCILCQQTCIQGLRQATEEGIRRLKDVAEERKTLNDVNKIVVVERLMTVLEDESADVKCHKNCYSSFTSEKTLYYLRKKKGSQEPEAFVQGQQQSRRSIQEHSIAWDLCMFCQNSYSKEIMHYVSTIAFSEKVLSKAQMDDIMRVRLANVSDLVACKGKYHLKCWVEFDRKIKRLNTSENVQGSKSNKCMDQLCYSLRSGLEQGCVYDMSEVWIRYQNICEENKMQAPKSYISRRATFYDQVKRCIGDKAIFVTPHKQPMIMYPSKTSGYAFAESLKRDGQKIDSDSSEDSADDNDLWQPNTCNVLQELVHTAMKIREDLEETPGHTSAWGGIDQEHIDKVIPNSLHLFLSVLFEGTSALDSENEDENETKKKICSTAQDIVYNVSNARKLTPKHIGLGLTLHQATRSENLINLFHAAGHTIGIDTVRRIDTSMADSILERYEQNGYIFIPDGIDPFVPGRIILASCDNIDVLEETIDGKNTFHCTQMMLWQRGPSTEKTNTERVIGRPRSLNRETIEKLHKLDHLKLPTGTRPSPVFHVENRIEADTWFKERDVWSEVKYKDEAWLLSRMHDDEHQQVPSWSSFNAASSTVNPPVTTPGMLPILQAPADSNDTMTTVLNRFKNITSHLGQKYTVVVADQPLYSRCKELIWGNPVKYENVIMMMGDLHILFNFLKAIVQHFENGGLDDIWVESDLFAVNSVQGMMEGKAYYRAVRGHTWTYEALSRIRWNHFNEWLTHDGKEVDCGVQLSKITELFERDQMGYEDDISKAVMELIDVLRHKKIQELMKQYDSEHANEPNYVYWSTYLDMVEILLTFIRANRDGDWELHLDAFAAMLPYLTMYDHTNYARWGPVYLAEMKGLQVSSPSKMYREFVNGNFVIKRRKGRFNQVPPDQATEWQNRMCKISNGIIGITRNDPARDRFCITWAERSLVSHEVKTMFDVDDEDEESFCRRKDALPSRMAHDEAAVKKLIEQLNRFNVFRPKHVSENQVAVAQVESVKRTDISDEVEIDNDISFSEENAEVAMLMNVQQGEEVHLFPASCVGVLGDQQNGNTEEVKPRLVSLATNDVATLDIQQDLLTVRDRGEKAVQEFVQQRLLDNTVPFFNSLSRNNSKTFGTLYKTVVASKNNQTKTVKADRKLIQKLLNASSGGRKIQMHDILKHELSKVPLSLAKVNECMNSTSKSTILEVLSHDMNIDTPPDIPDPTESQYTCVLIDGHALIQALGKPLGCNTFEDYAKAFLNAARTHINASVKRIDVVFDTYIKQSIKGTTRGKRGAKKRPIRKLVEHGNVPLPKVWSQFISLGENKADLACFLSQYLMTHDGLLPEGCEVVTGGGFENPQKAQSSIRGDILQLGANHEEADTRLILHACEAVRREFNRILVVCRDTDVLLLLIHFLGNKEDIEVWMQSGTAKQKKHYPVHQIANVLSQQVKNNILGFHALTGCDSTSSLAGFGKKRCWKIFAKHPELLKGVGRDGPVEQVEEYICRLYGSPDCFGGVDQARYEIFKKGQKELEKLPPTKDALELHLIRCNYQAKIWLQADSAIQTVCAPSATGGWREVDTNQLDIVWSRLPSIPDACIELITCGCTSKCKTGACKCNKTKQICLEACGCNATDCRNPANLI